MKIHQWLSDPFSARTGLAIVQVEPGEVADVDKMLVLIDGGNTGHFGLSVKLLTVGKPPKVVVWSKLGNKRGESQFGFPTYPSMMEQSRFYEVHVSRD